MRRTLFFLLCLSVAGGILCAQQSQDRPMDRLRLDSRGELREIDDPLQTSPCNLANGDYDFCAACGICEEGEGDCDSDAECGDGLICVPDAGDLFGLGRFVDVCMAADTCPVDPGHRDYCLLCGPCDAELGDCDSEDQCSDGLTCVANIGDSYGWWADIDVCIELQCDLPKGHPDYCAVCGPCEEEAGDCDSDSECSGDLTCVNNVGSTYGFDSYVDVCIAVDDDECPVSENHSDYCALCGPCEEGLGDCDSNSECEAGLVCVDDYIGSRDVCLAPLDEDDDRDDCPVSEGHYDYCELCGGCEEDEGDCDSDSECADGLTCVSNIGSFYGWADDIDVCRVPGDTDCPVPPGHYDYCDVCGPCPVDEGDCDDDDECTDGLVCVSDIGADFEWESDVDVCQAECPVPLGDEDYCRLCGPCEEGEGGCVSDDECSSSDLACVEDVGSFFGYSPETSVCVGTNICKDLLGDYDYCKVCGPCEEEEGDCDTDSECDTGLACYHEAGPDYGFGWDVDVCLPRDPEECADLLGEDTYCEVCGPCDVGEGDCDGDDDCADGLFCISNVGNEYGWDPTIDVCRERDESQCTEMLAEGDLWDYCRLCGPCDLGAGDCDSDDECGTGLYCAEDVGENYGLDEATDVCEVNPECPDFLGFTDFCATCGPCLEGQGDCDSESECAEGLICADNIGRDYGFTWETDVCIAPVGAGDCPLPPGHYDYCAVCGPCNSGEGDCDGDSQCAPGLVCKDDLGALLGFPVDADICQEP